MQEVAQPKKVSVDEAYSAKGSISSIADFGHFHPPSSNSIHSLSQDLLASVCFIPCRVVHCVDLQDEGAGYFV
jgi:hypothetical protein